MTDIAIRCEGLAKQYRIGERESYKALRDVITEAFTSPFRRLFSRSRLSSNGNVGHENPTIWALKDVSFEIKCGEVVGIIGRNGAGKSTLLKILSRITEPTHGHVDIWGRVGSLLEVGTGFHPELTGRDNIFLNGAILGMKKAEIKRKFDEIIAFAEVEKFIDTPVKRYSSGMYVRLAFAVAAHMETEILLVDEVLAVGDAQFQKRCLGKMGDVAKHGRTVLLVSHNMAAIQSLCSHCILFQDGRNQEEGDSRSVAEHYLANSGANVTSQVDLRDASLKRIGRVEIFSSLLLANGDGVPTTNFIPSDKLVLQFTLNSPFPIRQPVLTIGIDNAMGQRVFSVSSLYSQQPWGILEKPTVVRCGIPELRLIPGRYSLGVCVGTAYEPLMDAIPEAALFDVAESDHFGTGRMPTQDLGVVLVSSQWEVEPS